MSFIIEISTCGSITVCTMDGDELSGGVVVDLLDCAGSGDATKACRYVLDTYDPKIRIVKKINGEYKNVLASKEDKKQVCESIYFESDTDFSDEDKANLYIVWYAAHVVACNVD